MAPRLAAIVLGLVLLACPARTSQHAHEVSVEVDRVALDPRSGSPVVVLEERHGHRSLAIWIGFPEASSIASEMDHDHPPRPNTHDLAKRLIEGLHGSLSRVVVTELRDGTYFAVMVLDAPGGAFEVDARPSDAIALALRTGAPLFVREALFDAASNEPPPPPAADEHST
jgi:bifunctional DNase/RNase